MAADLTLFSIVMGVSFGTAALTLLAAARIATSRLRRTAAAAQFAEAEAGVVFLFDDTTLIDATLAARAMLGRAAAVGSDWERLAGLIRHRFPGLDAAIGTLAETGLVEIASEAGAEGALVAEWRGGLARITLADKAALGAEAAAGLADRHCLAAVEAELATLRAVTRSGPTVVWKQDASGTVIWANDVYFSLAEAMLGADAAYSWPPPALFPLASAGHGETTSAPVRTALRASEGAPARWFECQGYAEGENVLFYAAPADGLVDAEEALREFVQTLSKTFAHLPIGLAIFDRARRLALFNPALTDLTALEVEFLIARPTLFAFLDRLRDRRRIPEPRDYSSWRRRMAELEAAAAGGFVQETWTLPTGQTYRVTGRPHPDGAVAFLFEDISAEISLTRRFRSEIELGQTVIDSLDEAIAVFSAGGLLSYSNAAYARLWGIDPAVTLVEIGILEATRHWQSRTEPTPIWGDARDFIAERGERADWTGEVKLTDGPALQCRFKPLGGGATLVGFVETEAAIAAARPDSMEAARRQATAPVPAFANGTALREAGSAARTASFRTSRKPHLGLPI